MQGPIRNRDSKDLKSAAASRPQPETGMPTGRATPSNPLTTVVRRYYRAVDSGDVDALLELFTDDALYLRPGYPPMRGRRAIDEFYRGQRVIASGSHSLLEVTEAPNSVVVQGRFVGLSHAGDELTASFADIFHGACHIAFRQTYFYVPLI
jgi:steroid delta-isomerase